MASEKRGLKTKISMVRMTPKQYEEIERYCEREEIPAIATGIRTAALITVRRKRGSK